MLARSTSSFVVLSCCAALLGACGDDGSPGTGDGSTGSTTDATTTGMPNTTMDSVDTTAGDPSTGDPTTGVDTTAGPSESSSDDGGSTTGMPGDCAGMSFATLTSMNNDMSTNLDVAGLVNCNQDLTITATGGSVCVVDDGAGGYFYTVESIELMDIPPVTCGLAEVGITNMSIVNTGDGMEVTVPMAGGAMTGNQSIQVLGDVEGTALGMAIGPTPLMMFEGVLPEGDATVGADTTVTYADDMTVIATAMPEVIPGVMVTITLTGLDGSLTFGP